MSIDVRLPEIADSVTSAKVAVWLKKEGDRVAAGETIVEIETDKTTVEVEAPASGVLQKILVPAGADGVAVNSVIAIITEREMEASAVDDSPAPPPAPVLDPAEWVAPHPTVPARVVSADSQSLHFVPAPARADAESDNNNVNITPLARRMAAIADVNLRDISADADRQITKADIDRVLGRVLTSPAAMKEPPRAVTAPSSAGVGRFRDEPLSALRRATATRLQQAKQTIPHFYLQANCRVDALVELRDKVNRSMVPDGTKITFTDVIVYVAARALRHTPMANASWSDDAIRCYDDIDIAVAVNTAKGLLTPIVREAQNKTVAQISRELKALSERARAGQLKRDEYTGGTFTISNLGMFNVTNITPIVNPPHACILGVGAIETVPVARNDGLALGRVMGLTLAADHRVIDGAQGAQLIGNIRRLLEEPISLALDL